MEWVKIGLAMVALWTNDEWFECVNASKATGTVGSSHSAAITDQQRM
jgi:hypothetical protein